MRDLFIFDGNNSADYNVWAFQKRKRSTPVRSVESVTIAGRHGSLEMDNNRYENVSVLYDCIIPTDAIENINGFFDKYLSVKGYKRLEDSFDSEEFRLAHYVGGTEKTVLDEMAKFEMEFECLPQRFLKSGEKTFTAQKSTVYRNPTSQEAKPIIRVRGNGSLTVYTNGSLQTTITITNNPSYIDIDCDLLDAHYGAVNCNNRMSGSFPVLKGDTTFNWAGLTSVEVTPRWFRL